MGCVSLIAAQIAEVRGARARLLLCVSSSLESSSELSRRHLAATTRARGRAMDDRPCSFTARYDGRSRLPLIRPVTTCRSCARASTRRARPRRLRRADRRAGGRRHLLRARHGDRQGVVPRAAAARARDLPAIFRRVHRRPHRQLVGARAADAAAQLRAGGGDERAQEPQAESTSTGRKRSRSAKAAEAEGVEAAPPPTEAAAAAAKAAAGAGATTVVGKGPSWHWLSSKHHRGGVHAFATRSTRVGLAKYQAEVPHAVEAAAPPPAPPPRCRCGQPCVWDRRRWWCALADSADGGCGHEEAVPPVPLCPVCLCGERTVWLRERWWCARAVGGCGFEEEPDTDRDSSEYARDAPRRIDNREIERQQAVRTAALLTAAAYSGTSWVYGAPGVMSASDRVQLLETDADVAHRADRGGSDGADAAGSAPAAARAGAEPHGPHGRRCRARPRRRWRWRRRRCGERPCRRARGRRPLPRDGGGGRADGGSGGASGEEDGGRGAIRAPVVPGVPGKAPGAHLRPPRAPRVARDGRPARRGRRRRRRRRCRRRGRRRPGGDVSRGRCRVHGVCVAR